VVARTVQFLSENRDDEHLIGDADVPDAEKPELADASEA
jgi:hypothetical protein